MTKFKILIKSNFFFPVTINIGGIERVMRKPFKNITHESPHPVTFIKVRTLLQSELIKFTKESEWSGEYEVTIGRKIVFDLIPLSLLMFSLLFLIFFIYTEKNYTLFLSIISFIFWINNVNKLFIEVVKLH
jgi:hypothetical protein